MIAHTTPLEQDVDLNDVAGSDGYLFVREGVGFAGRGVAATVPIDEAAEFLSAIEHRDNVGGTNGPIALGALPFLPGSAANLVIPQVIVAKDDRGRGWVTRIDGSDEPIRTSSEPVPSAAAYTLRPLVPVDHYLRAVAAARDAVREGRMNKAVIARPIAVESDAAAMTMTIENVPSENPRTGRITALSVVSLLRKRGAALRDRSCDPRSQRR